MKIDKVVSSASIHFENEKEVEMLRELLFVSGIDNIQFNTNSAETRRFANQLRDQLASISVNLN